MRPFLLWVIGAAVLGALVMQARQAPDGPLAAGGAPRATPTPAPPLPRAAVTLPEGVRVVPEREGFEATTDLRAGSIAVPSGHLAVDDFFLGKPQVTVGVPTGRHPVRATLARPVEAVAGDGRVAAVTLETAPGPVVRWTYAGMMGTDGGVAGLASTEAADRMADDDVALGNRLSDVLQAAGSNGIGRLDLGSGLDVVTSSIGLGDGGYAVYTGEEAGGEVARVVIDGGLLHFAWPEGPDAG